MNKPAARLASDVRNFDHVPTVVAGASGLVRFVASYRRAACAEEPSRFVVVADDLLTARSRAFARTSGSFCVLLSVVPE